MVGRSLGQTSDGAAAVSGDAILIAASARDYAIAREMEIKERQRVSDFMYWQGMTAGQSRDEFAAAHGLDDLSEQDVLRDWWAACGDVLHKLAVAIGRKAQIDALPADLFLTISGLAKYLAAGDIPASVLNVAGKGRSAAGPTEANDIAIAVAYIKASRGELFHEGQRIHVKNRAPVKTVCERYGVDASTVRRWQRSCPEAWLGIGPMSVELLYKRMDAAGARYKQAGRSAAAIRHRATKRAGAK
jgi:hypothetical protein